MIRRAAAAPPALSLSLCVKLRVTLSPPLRVALSPSLRVNLRAALSPSKSCAREA